MLDVGCANGFLLRCFLEWSDYEITPYGIDTDRNLLRQARLLLAPYLDNFADLSVYDLDTLEAVGLPDLFTYVYWNIWDDFLFNSEAQRNAVLQAAEVVSPGGRLILGFYDRDLLVISQKIEIIQHLFGKLGGRIENAPRREVMIWLDR